MGASKSKLSVTPIWRDHIDTLVTSRPGTRDRRALIERFGLPLVAGGAYWWFGSGHLSTVASGALATATGLLAAFMLQMTVSMFDRSAALADTAPESSPRVLEHTELLQALASNSAYASLVGLATTAALIVATVGTDRIGEVASIVSVSLPIHLGLLMLMLLRPVHLLGRRHRIEARTGSLHDVE